MRELTQTHLHPGGNCWQTCMAMLLDVDPEELPSQHDIEQPGPACDVSFRKPDQAGRYTNPLQAYLEKHHGLCFWTVDTHGMHQRTPPDLLALLTPVGLHVMVGPTVRTAETGQFHAVVGEGGKLRWDPHPSRAGLLQTTRWEFLVPVSDESRASHRRMPWWRCICPACEATR